MKNQALAIAFALTSAFCFALASVVQQKAASTISEDDATGGRLLLKLVRRPIWLAGVVLDTLGFGAQAAALAVGSIMIVQPLLVTTLLFALPLGRVITKRHVYASDWLWAAVLTVSLGVFIDAGNPSDGIDRAPFSKWMVVLGIIAVGSVAAIIAASRTKGRVRALLLATTAGVLFGTASALTKSVVDAFDLPLDQAIPQVFKSWETYVLAVAISTGFVLQQSAYQAGNLKESLPAMIVLDPIASVFIGMVVLEEALQVDTGLGWVVVIASAAAALIGTIQLSRSSAIHEAHPT